jgi:hypothetical protein
MRPYTYKEPRVGLACLRDRLFSAYCEQCNKAIGRIVPEYWIRPYFVANKTVDEAIADIKSMESK